MVRLRITVLKTLNPSELFEEIPVARMDWMVPCEVFREGQEFYVGEHLMMPKGFCESAWRAINHNVRTLLYGGVLPHHVEGDVAVNCCTDGLRPVIFKIERLRLDEEADEVAEAAQLEVPEGSLL